MVDMISIKEASMKWGITETRITKMCRDGRIPGAKKAGKNWLIPADTEKPADKRIKSGAYIKSAYHECLPLPVGISDYRLVSSEYYYIDKTMMIKDFIDERHEVSLFTRPRRFGKTLNMDMLHTFFEKTDEDTSVYFSDKKIWKCGQKYCDYQGKYPVIHISFKDVRGNTWSEVYESITLIIRREYKRHSELFSDDKLSESDKNYTNNILQNNIDESDMVMSLTALSRMLHEHYGTKVIIIIDEYDTPIQYGYAKGFYDEVVLLMRNLYSYCLKDNSHLAFGLLTGILNLKDNLLGELDNLTINSVLDNKYSEYFGFTADEIREMTKYYSSADKYSEIPEWYGCYRFGKSDIFNPWSVINYFSNACVPRAFWQSTGSNDIISKIIAEADTDIYDRFISLLSGQSFTVYINTDVVYPQIKNNPSTIYSYLLFTGYLKALKTTPLFSGDFMCEVVLPNKEVSFIYNKEILDKLCNIIPRSTAISINEAIYSCDGDTLYKYLQILLSQASNCNDDTGDYFCQSFILALFALLGDSYTISYEKSPNDIYNIILISKNKNLIGFRIVLKKEGYCSDNNIKKPSINSVSKLDENNNSYQEVNINGMRVINHMN